MLWMVNIPTTGFMLWDVSTQFKH